MLALSNRGSCLNALTLLLCVGGAFSMLDKEVEGGQPSIASRVDRRAYRETKNVLPREGEGRSMIDPVLLGGT